MRGMIVGLAAALSLVAPCAFAQSPPYRFVRSDDPVLDANAYLLTLIAADPAARKAVTENPAVAFVGLRLAETRQSLLKTCRLEPVCAVDKLMLSDSEVASIGLSLAPLTGPGGPLAHLVREQMRPSGRFQKYAGLDDGAMFESAFAETARGVNRLFRVYADGDKPRYPAIDSMSYAPADPHLRQIEREALEASTDPSPTATPLTPWFRVAFDLLIANQRDEAARYEPLETGENAKAFARARRLDWKATPYTAIVVPGAGTEDGETHISPVGTFRDRLAVQRWREGKAPFLLVSGGHVHPNKTAFAEAIEMKRDLMARYGVPAEAIIVDPYARHTTTNLRNAVRLLFRMGAPMERPVLITTSQDQSFSLETPAFAARNKAELGYEPMTGYRRLSPFDVAATPNLVSLHADPSDPLDP